MKSLEMMKNATEVVVEIMVPQMSRNTYSIGADIYELFNNVTMKSGIRYDLLNEELIKYPVHFINFITDEEVLSIYINKILYKLAEIKKEVGDKRVTVMIDGVTYVL